MFYSEFLPAPPLKSLIHRYGIVEIEDAFRNPVKEKLAPLPGFCWLFTSAIQSPLYIEMANKLSPLSPILEIPQNNRSTTIIHNGAFRMFYVRFMPGVHLKIEKAHGLKADPAALYALFMQNSPADAMVKFADHYFISNQVEERVPDPTTLEAIKRIHSDAAFPLSNLSRDLFFSPRHLRRVFSLNTGVPLKAYQQIIRFSHCIQQLEQRKDLRIQDVAFQNGFSDQTHFNKEFKLFTGLTPKQYLAGKYPLTTCMMWRDTDNAPGF